MFDRRKYERIYRTRRECCFNRYHETAGDREADPDPGGFHSFHFQGEGCHRPFPDRYGQDACLPAACNPESGYRKEYDAGPHHDSDERTLQTDFDVLRPFAIKLDIDAADIIGGRTIENQLRKLKRDPAVIIGTPGRLLDHIRRRSLDLSNVKTVILDEADQMLANGFREDIEALVDETPKKRQVLLFSATMPDDAKRLARKYMNQPVYIDVAEKAAASTVDQRVYERRNRTSSNCS